MSPNAAGRVSLSRHLPNKLSHIWRPRLGPTEEVKLGPLSLEPPKKRGSKRVSVFGGYLFHPGFKGRPQGESRVVREFHSQRVCGCFAFTARDVKEILEMVQEIYPDNGNSVFKDGFLGP